MTGIDIVIIGAAVIALAGAWKSGLLGGAEKVAGKVGEALGDLPQNLSDAYDHYTTPLPKDEILTPASERVINELWDKIWRDRGGTSLSNVPYLTRQEYGMLVLTYNAYIYNSAMGAGETLTFNAAARAFDMIEHHKGLFV